MSDFLRHFAERLCSFDGRDLKQLAELYSHDVHYTGPLDEARDLIQLQACFDKQHANFTEFRYDFHGFHQAAEGEGYLRWNKSYRHPRLSGNQWIRINGCSHLLWHEKVYLHRDYFDASLLRYEQLPFLGRAMAWFHGRTGRSNPIAPRRAWLTGATAGIGLAIAEELLRSGSHLALSARAVAPLEKLSKRYPGQVLLVPGDLTDSQQVRRIGERIQREWGALDIVILNAGTCDYVDARHFDGTLIERVVRTNLLASSYCVRTALPLLRAGITPHLVGLASPATALPLPAEDKIGIALHGMGDLFDSLRSDLAVEGITVTTISPGFGFIPRVGDTESPISMQNSAQDIARYIGEKIQSRPLEIFFPSLFIAELWPLPQRAERQLSALDSPAASKTRSKSET